MGLLDNGDRVSDAELDAKTTSLAGDFTQGLRSGYESAKGQLHKLAGTTMNAVGLDGSEQNAKSKVANAYAQVDASELVPFEQADVGRNGMRWLAGALGQSAPISAAITGAGLATGGAGFVPAMLAGTAAGAPFKAGEILQRQEADPANRYASPAQHLANAALPAVASAGVESAIPAFTTMRLAGKTGLSTMGQIAGRTAASVPAEGLSEGAGELALQAGLNQMNPNAGYDWEAIKQNAIQGAVVGGALGTVGGVGEVGHKIAGSPGRALDAVAGLVPDSVKKGLSGAKKGLAGATEAAGEAADTATEYAKDGFDHTAEAATKAAEWAKGAISAKVADVQKWGKEFMDDPAAPDSFKAQVQDAVRNPGDKAKAVWLATEKFARDAAAKVSKEADAADIPTKLRALHKTMSDGVGRLKDRLASGGEPADDAEILAAGDDPAKLTEVFDKADKNVLTKTQEWAKDLLAEHLTDEQKAKLKTWTDNITDKASVQGIAALHKAQAAGKDLAERANAFAKAARSTPAGKAVEGAITTARTTDAGKAVEGAARSVKDAFTPKKSDAIPEGLREKIGESIMDVLGPYHPALKSKFVRNAKGETTVPLQDLADGLRSVILAASKGEEVSSDVLVKLIDVAGPKTRELIDAVHRAVGEPAAGNAAFFQAIEDAVQAGRANESVLAVMQKSLKPELQGAVRTDELKKEAELLRLWLQSNDAKGKLSKPEITHRDEVMRSAIEHRYGDKAEAVLRAIRANIAKEQKLTEASEGVNPLSSDDDMREGPAGVNTGRREGSARDETVRSHFYADGKKGEELYLAPEHAPPSKFKSPAEQRMVKAKTANPDAQVEFRYVKDLDESDPKVEAMISAKFDELVETAMLEQGMTEAEAESWANKELDKYGLVVAESSRQETRITDAELASLKLDSKFADSPSRIDSKGPATEENTHPKTKRRTDGNVALDAVRITEFMNKKMGAVHEYSPTDDKGRRHRDARMFTEGIAALTDRLGYSFDIPDSTQITRQGMTWGEAKKLDVRTPKDKGYDAKSQELDRQRASYRSADPTAKANLRQMAEETLQKRADAKDKELSRDGFDAPPLDDISAEIANRIARIKELEAQRDGLDLTTRAGRAKEKILFAEQAALENINLRTGFHNVRQEVDPFGPTQDALRGKEEGVPIDVNADGSAREDTVMGRRKPATPHPNATKGTSFTPRKTKDELITEGNHAALQALRSKERQLARKLRQLDTVLRKDMIRKEAAALQRVQGMSPEAREELINTLHAKYVETEDAGEAEAAARGGPPSPKAVAAKKAAFLKKALSGDADLLKTLKASTDAKGLQRAAMALQGKPEAQKALDATNARLSELVQDEDVAYGLQTKKYSAQFVAPGQTGPVDRGAVERHIEKVLGPSVGVAWKNILHAGEFVRTATGDVINLSMHSLNPMSTAYHESLHGLFARLRDAKQGDIAAVLERAGASAPVLNQLKKLLANEPAALAQLGNAEERAAYMYQFWSQRDANGKRLLNVGEKATGIFQRIAQFLREITGLWTNDERAVKIMEYFQSGEYEKTRGDPNAVYRALMEPGITRPLAKLKAMAEPFTDLGEALVSAGGERLRDSGIPALRQLADAMKLKTTSEGDDPGYLPTSRAEHARRMNQLGADLKPYTEDEIKEATVAMQEGVRAHGKNARIVQRIVQKRLTEALDYMQAAGVNIDHIGAGPKADGVPYFPRSWDASYISSHQKEFLAMADKYVQSGEWKGDPQKTMNKLMVTDGAEFNVEVDKPGMQPSKQRVLNFISHADAAPFMRKDLHQIMNNYLLQATRRAEWSRRFGDDGIGVAMMLIAAKAEGATPEQLEMATKFIRAVDGTLGDTLNPTARRMMGNMIVYQNIRLLPLAIFSSIVDPLGIMVRGGAMRDAFHAFKRGVKESVKNFQDDPTGDSMTQLAEAIGTIENASLVHTMGASYGQGMVGDKGRAINDTFFRYNLMDQWNRSVRTTATEAALGFLARHASNPTAHSARYLRELGLTAADVQLDANGRPKLFETDGLTTDHSNRMLAAVNRWVDGAVLRPDAVDKALWMSDPHFALVSHLKSFVLSFHETILKRVAHEARNGNYTPAMALASYVPVMLAADMVKGLIQGGGEEPPWKKSWGLSDYAWNSMERAGLFGSGQFAIDALTDVTQRGGSGIGALTGPTVEQLTDAVRVLGGNAQFRPFAVKSLPANALYAGVLGNESTDPKFVE